MKTSTKVTICELTTVSNEEANHIMGGPIYMKYRPIDASGQTAFNGGIHVGTLDVKS